MMSKKREVYEVFTPRYKGVNDKMYIHREQLEQQLKLNLKRQKHLIIYGESGCGKSWLYSKALNDLNFDYTVINLADAARHGSITDVFKYKLAQEKNYENTQYTDSKSASVGVSSSSGGLSHQKTYQRLSHDPVREFLSLKGRKQQFIVFENLELIFENEALMDELGNLIILLDDIDFSAKFLIVGVPSGVMQYFSQRTLLKTVSNRLLELEEVRGLSTDQVQQLIKRGFIEELRYQISETDLAVILSHVMNITSGIPQKVHEYCELLAYEIEGHRFIYDSHMLESTDRKWLKESLHLNYLLIKEMMNSRETSSARRNQVLYCLGQLSTTTFTTAEMEALVLRHFPNSLKDKKLNLRMPLNHLSKWQHSFIKQREHEFVITDKRYLLAIRVMLHKLENESIERLEIDKIS